ncbi:MAG: hypothetical protein NVS4B5_15230 [Vulcanimicrobiaceae bacterium]
MTPFIRQVEISADHNVRRNLDLLREAEIDSSDPAGYTVPDSWVAPQGAPNQLIIMHVGTVAHHGLEARRWPESNFAELGRRLLARGFDLRLITGPDEVDATARVAEAIGDVDVLSPTLESTARLLCGARAVVANDNGIAHMAAGLRVPTLALLGPTPAQHGPFGAHAVTFRPSACPPCFDVVTTDSRCKLDIDYECLKKDLSVDVVDRRLQQLLRETALVHSG